MSDLAKRLHTAVLNAVTYSQHEPWNERKKTICDAIDAVLEARDRDAARWRWDRDAARWRWARADKILWSGTYDYGVISPEDADAIADAPVVQGNPIDTTGVKP